MPPIIRLWIDIPVFLCYYYDIFNEEAENVANKNTVSTETVKTEHPNKIGIREGIAYMLGEGGNLFLLTYVSSYLKVFYTDVLKIPTEKVANLFLFTRLWDAVNDPMWGAIVAKKAPSKDGKYRPYLKWLAIPLALAQILCFIDVSSYTKNPVLLLVFAYITYIGFGMLYTGMNVPFGSLASVITDDPDGRTLLSTFRTIGGGVGGAAPLLLAPFLIYTTVTADDGSTYNVADGPGMFKFALVMGILSIFFYYACHGMTKERVPSEAKPKVDMKKIYGGMLKSKPFIVLALTGILISGQLQFASLNQYLYKNYFCNTSLSVVGTIAQYAPLAIMIPFAGKIVKKYGKKEVCGITSLISAIAAVATFIIKPAPDQAWLFLVMQFAIGFGYSFVSITNWAVVADVIDYQLYKTGIKNESAVYAVYSFCRKLGQTAADYGGLMLLGKIGYEAETMANAGFVPGISEGILAVCTVIPAITYTLIFVFYQFFYPLTKEKLEPVYEYVRQNNENMGA